MIPNSHRRLAFTLAEMFAVFVVLGVILALALPAIQSRENPSDERSVPIL